MDDSQLLKGILQACVLSIIFQGETYGYQIIQELTSYGFNHVKDGTLYPILARLEKTSILKVA
jgi:PadR family transcriptional regulator PadR